MPISSRRAFVTTPLGLLGLAALQPLEAFATPRADTLSIGGFLDAVREGDVEAVRAAIASDPALARARDERGRSVFAVAHLAGHAEIGELIRAAGYEPDLAESALVADWERFATLAEQAPGLINRAHPIGGTAMHAAAKGGAGSQIWRVYQHGGEPNANPDGPAGFTALRVALEYDDLATAEMTAATLLSNGADPNAPQADGRSALHAAAARGSVDLVEMLIRQEGEIEARDDRGRTPLELADAGDHEAIVQMLEQHGDIPRDHSTSRDAYDVNGDPYRRPDLDSFARPLRLRVVGASHFDLDTVRGIVDRHPELAGSVATTTERAVEACAHTGRRPIVDYLLEKGAPYSLPTAAMRGDVARVRELLDEDPLRINERGAHGFALLWYPIIGGGHLEVTQLLLERGAQVERQHHLGTTALHWAALGGDVDMAALLIEHDADVNRVGRKFDAAGDTPLAMTEKRGNEAVAKLLRQHGANEA